MRIHHSPNLLLELPSLEARKPLVTAGRLGGKVELQFDDDDDYHDGDGDDDIKTNKLMIF